MLVWFDLRSVHTRCVVSVFRPLRYPQVSKHNHPVIHSYIVVVFCDLTAHVIFSSVIFVCCCGPKFRSVLSSEVMKFFSVSLQK